MQVYLFVFVWHFFSCYARALSPSKIYHFFNYRNVLFLFSLFMRICKFNVFFLRLNLSCFFIIFSAVFTFFCLSIETGTLTFPCGSSIVSIFNISPGILNLLFLVVVSLIFWYFLLIFFAASCAFLPRCRLVMSSRASIVSILPKSSAFSGLPKSTVGTVYSTFFVSFSFVFVWFLKICQIYFCSYKMTGIVWYVIF